MKALLLLLLTIFCSLLQVSRTENTAPNIYQIVFSNPYYKDIFKKHRRIWEKNNWEYPLEGMQQMIDTKIRRKVEQVAMKKEISITPENLYALMIRDDTHINQVYNKHRLLFDKKYENLQKYFINDYAVHSMDRYVSRFFKGLTEDLMEVISHKFMKSHEEYDEGSTTDSDAYKTVSEDEEESED